MHPSKCTKRFWKRVLTFHRGSDCGWKRGGNKVIFLYHIANLQPINAIYSFLKWMWHKQNSPFPWPVQVSGNTLTCLFSWVQLRLLLGLWKMTYPLYFCRSSQFFLKHNIPCDWQKHTQMHTHRRFCCPCWIDRAFFNFDNAYRKLQ